MERIHLWMTPESGNINLCNIGKKSDLRLTEENARDISYRGINQWLELLILWNCRKVDGAGRFRVDFYKAKLVVKLDTYPIPQTDELLG